MSDDSEMKVWDGVGTKRPNTDPPDLGEIKGPLSSDDRTRLSVLETFVSDLVNVLNTEIQAEKPVSVIVDAPNLKNVPMLDTQTRTLPTILEAVKNIVQRDKTHKGIIVTDARVKSQQEAVIRLINALAAKGLNADAMVSFVDTLEGKGSNILQKFETDKENMVALQRKLATYSTVCSEITGNVINLTQQIIQNMSAEFAELLRKIGAQVVEDSKARLLINNSLAAFETKVEADMKTRVAPELYSEYIRGLVNITTDDGKNSYMRTLVDGIRKYHSDWITSAYELNGLFTATQLKSNEQITQAISAQFKSISQTIGQQYERFQNTIDKVFQQLDVSGNATSEEYKRLKSECEAFKKEVDGFTKKVMALTLRGEVITVDGKIETMIVDEQQEVAQDVKMVDIRGSELNYIYEYLLNLFRAYSRVHRALNQLQDKINNQEIKDIIRDFVKPDSKGAGKLSDIDAKFRQIKGITDPSSAAYSFPFGYADRQLLTADIRLISWEDEGGYPALWKFIGRMAGKAHRTRAYFMTPIIPGVEIDSPDFDVLMGYYSERVKQIAAVSQKRANEFVEEKGEIQTKNYKRSRSPPPPEIIDLDVVDMQVDSTGAPHDKRLSRPTESDEQIKSRIQQDMAEYMKLLFPALNKEQQETARKLVEEQRAREISIAATRLNLLLNVGPAEFKARFELFLKPNAISAINSSLIFLGNSTKFKNVTLQEFIASDVLGMYFANLCALTASINDVHTSENYKKDLSERLSLERTALTRKMTEDLERVAPFRWKVSRS